MSVEFFPVKLLYPTGNSYLSKIESFSDFTTIVLETSKTQASTFDGLTDTSTDNSNRPFEYTVAISKEPFSSYIYPIFY